MLIFFSFLKTRTVARKIPFDDPVVLNYVRIAYVSVQLLLIGVYQYAAFKVCAFSLFWRLVLISVCWGRSNKRMT